MKVLPLLFLLVVFSFSSTAQDTVARKMITVNSLKEESKQPLINAVFKYPQFAQARLIYKDNGVAEAKLNYHRYLQQLLFINEKHDTLVLAHPEYFSMFILNRDTFYFHEKTFPYVVTHFDGVNLAKNEFISLVGKEKKGLYGSYSAVSSANSEQTFTNNEIQSTSWLKVDENSIYKLDQKFLLKDKFNSFFPANKKNFFNLFSQKEAELKKYLKENKVDFNKHEDLVQLLSYLNAL